MKKICLCLFLDGDMEGEGLAGRQSGKIGDKVGGAKIVFVSGDKVLRHCPWGCTVPNLFAAQRG